MIESFDIKENHVYIGSLELLAGFFYIFAG